MRITILLVLLYFLNFSSCKQNQLHLNKIEGERIEINNTITENADIEAYIKPYREHIQNDLDSIIAYAPHTYTKSDGEFNTAIGNFMADAVYQEANPIFKKRTGHDIDMVLLNHGGIRSILSKGNISKRTAFELMPFENSIVVVALKKPQIDSLLLYLSKSTKAHPISQLKLTLNKNFEIVDAKIKGENIANKTYYVATNDYLYNGGDNMRFFKTNDSLYVLNYKIRNALIDYFIKNDTINPIRDDRFTQIN
ncbi:5'-nucleotidase C-terminal domain-containing protein [Tamlana sp. 62-3]|uniref:5'-nucleotidase C-terminal domain-containing protein n=1 Tax=Neotamlana sargassicola TaxID=2883125 RepID=A0A9X1L8X9_9FLAO|nr:5'-nucleotidase [Tamlana sargassicola]MCB4809313.1 5'-nucleotidase C-terminal domain-containing protein [Tamlana sargassicola]